MTRRLGKLFIAEKIDADEAKRALSLQVKAWRNLAMIALVDQDRARRHAQWLFFNSVPFVNGPALEKFIADTEEVAREHGIKAGVFTETVK